MMSFDNLWWLVLLPLPWIIRQVIKPVLTQYDAGLKVPFFSYLQTLKKNETKKLEFKQLNLAYFVWLLLLIAAAGPEWEGKAIHLPRAGRDILLAIDISGSMQIPDMQVNNQPTDRLTVVKNVAEHFINDRSGDRMGLVLFGTKAYLQTPLTFDLETVRHMLLDATVGLAGTQTAIGDAIGMSIKHLKNYPNDNKVLILLTDGVNNEGSVTPLEAAKIAAKYGIRIYTVGLGSNQIVVPSLLGPQILSGEYELDEDTLKEIASVTKGMYFRAKDPEELMTVYEQLNKIEARMGEKEVFRPKTPLYYWPLGLAFLLVMYVIYKSLPRGGN
ncbi:MAG: VWA domain-containing protein [Gammaproteobacteria bacterium]|nr:VWA domain-containing protein [Gammaproteobacteria bacterium]